MTFKDHSCNQAEAFRGAEPGLSQKTYPQLGIQVPRIFLPKSGIDLDKWAIIACDQYTSQPEYWKSVEYFVGDAPSTLHLILPEIYLDGPEESERISKAQDTMLDYLQSGLLEPQDGFIYVERQSRGKTRKGLLLALDLEQYDYHKGSRKLVRATEGTIESRIPPRMRIRSGAALELPHILVLIDDPEFTVIEPLSRAKKEGWGLHALYDFELMKGGGHLSGCLVNEPALEAGVIDSLAELASAERHAARYGAGPDEAVMLFAAGDGNHSLATAKSTWDQIRARVGQDHPARYALVEIVNLHDPALVFEPIHRILFGVKEDILPAILAYFGPDTLFRPCLNCWEMVHTVEEANGRRQVIGLVSAQGFGVLEIENPPAHLAASSIQPFLDQFIQSGGASKIDYVHGQEVVCELGSTPGSAGFYMPCMDKNELFKTVIIDGALPRKTFSMGEADQKRFYMECRQIA